ncbi:WecB/TagA/CpsF family glycosyltransferase [Effusibacillus consociatus]|uniref:N-acetylglucosaminyldiphosphoundecaprenol N-acetyl-beta-D-mannosaminyltransferase n=1 Tax=Effusibacillus consociatus TaxID=1117041 RepID=A0ABV9Q841_9BACL
MKSGTQVRTANTVDILGVPFSTLSFADTIKLILSWMEDGLPRQVVTANPEIVMFANQNREMMSLLQRADLITPDGIGVVYAARLFGSRIVERVTGADMLPPLFENAHLEGWPVYLLGANPESNRLALENLSRIYPNMKLAGRDGFFKEQDIPGIIEDIRRQSPRLLLVGLGLGKQERFIADHLHELNVPVSIGVGGCIDIYAGTVKRAPSFWRKMQLEWLYRLLKQPSRWRRQLALPRFAVAVLRQRFLTRSGRI